MFRIFTLFSILILFQTKGFTSAADSLTISGSASIKTILNHYEQVIEDNTGLKLNIIGKNSKRGILDLINGDADLAIISTPLSYLSKDLSDIDISSLRTYPFGKSSIVFIKHPNNVVRKITQEQMKQILKGEITNWKELGGNDLPIMVVTEFNGGGVRSLIEKKILNTEIKIPVKAMENASQIKEVVAAVPNALGITSASLIDSTVSIIETDQVMSQYIIFVAKPVADERITKFIKSLKIMNLQEVF
jgi:phosphate transport system substrate-binding protein